MRKNALIAVLIAAALLAPAAAAQTAPPTQAQGQKLVDTAKLFAEIAGAYEYTIPQGETMIVGFWVENGKLYGAPQGQESDFAELIKQESEKILFQATTQGGQTFMIEFVRGESGKFEKSILRNAEQGLEVVGLKIK